MTEIKGGEKINCPKDLNQYLICEPIFENTFSPDECESRKFYGDCYHCFASAIAKRDRQIKQLEEVVRPKGEWITNQEYIDKKFNGHYEGSCFNSPYNCSCCGYSPKDDRPKFCPNCGADMRGDSTHGR